MALYGFLGRSSISQLIRKYTLGPGRISVAIWFATLVWWEPGICAVAPAVPGQPTEKRAADAVADLTYPLLGLVRPVR